MLRLTLKPLPAVSLFFFFPPLHLYFNAKGIVTMDRNSSKKRPFEHAQTSACSDRIICKTSKKIETDSMDNAQTNDSVDNIQLETSQKDKTLPNSTGRKQSKMLASEPMGQSETMKRIAEDWLASSHGLPEEVVGYLKILRSEVENLKSQVEDNKKQNEDLKSEVEDNKKQNEDLKSEVEDKKQNEDLKSEVEDNTNRIEMLEGRLNYISNAFEPAKEYSLFKTAIYEAVRAYLENNSNPGTNPFLEKKRSLQSIQYATTRICSDILDFLTLIKQHPRDNIENAFKWQGPSHSKALKNETSQIFPVKTIRPLVLVGLQATVLYISKTEHETLMNMMPSARNVVVHNGRFLKALYETPTKSNRDSRGESTAERTFSATKRDVKQKISFFAETSGEVTFVTFENAVDAVIRGLKEKGVETLDEPCRGMIVQKLQKIYPQS